MDGIWYSSFGQYRHHAVFSGDRSTRTVDLLRSDGFQNGARPPSSSCYTRVFGGLCHYTTCLLPESVQYFR